jgi:hypothetical protein
LTSLYATRAPQNVTAVANAWYYPTGQANTVFVQLTTGQLLMVEMSEDQISRIQDLNTAAPGNTELATNR